MSMQVLTSSAPEEFAQAEIGDVINGGLVGVLGINFDVFTVRALASRSVAYSELMCTMNT